MTRKQYMTETVGNRSSSLCLALTHSFAPVRLVGVITELRESVEEQETLKEELVTRLDGTMKVLTGVRAGLEHVAEKLEASVVVVLLLVGPTRKDLLLLLLLLSIGNGNACKLVCS